MNFATASFTKSASISTLALIAAMGAIAPASAENREIREAQDSAIFASACDNTIIRAPIVVDRTGGFDRDSSVALFVEGGGVIAVSGTTDSGAEGGRLETKNSGVFPADFGSGTIVLGRPSGQASSGCMLSEDDAASNRLSIHVSHSSVRAADTPAMNFTSGLEVSDARLSLNIAITNSQFHGDIVTSDSVVRGASVSLTGGDSEQSRTEINGDVNIVANDIVALRIRQNSIVSGDIVLATTADGGGGIILELHDQAQILGDITIENEGGFAFEISNQALIEGNLISVGGGALDAEFFGGTFHTEAGSALTHQLSDELEVFSGYVLVLDGEAIEFSTRDLSGAPAINIFDIRANDGRLDRDLQIGRKFDDNSRAVSITSEFQTLFRSEVGVDVAKINLDGLTVNSPSENKLILDFGTANDDTLHFFSDGVRRDWDGGPFDIQNFDGALILEGKFNLEITSAEFSPIESFDKIAERRREGSNNAVLQLVSGGRLLVDRPDGVYDSSDLIFRNDALLIVQSATTFDIGAMDIFHGLARFSNQTVLTGALTMGPTGATGRRVGSFVFNDQFAVNASVLEFDISDLSGNGHGALSANSIRFEFDSDANVLPVIRPRVTGALPNSGGVVVIINASGAIRYLDLKTKRQDGGSLGEQFTLSEADNDQVIEFFEVDDHSAEFDFEIISLEDGTAIGLRIFQDLNPNDDACQSDLLFDIDDDPRCARAGDPGQGGGGSFGRFEDTNQVVGAIATDPEATPELVAFANSFNALPNSEKRKVLARVDATDTSSQKQISAAKVVNQNRIIERHMRQVRNRHQLNPAGSRRLSLSNLRPTHSADIQTGGLYVDTPQSLLRNRVWTTGFLALPSQDAIGTEPGFSATITGATIGYDFEVDRNVLLGGFFTTTFTDSSSDGPTDDYAEGYDYQGGLYAGLSYKGLTLDLVAAYGEGQTDASRVSPVTPGGRVQREVDNSIFSGMVKLAIDFPTQRLMLSPYASISASSLQEDSYTEFGDPAALSVAAVQRDSMQTELGMSMQYLFGLSRMGNQLETLIPSAHLAWRHEFLDEDANTKAQFVGAPNSGFLVADGHELPADLAKIGFGLDYDTGTGFSIGGVYSFEYRDSYTSHIASIAAALKF